MTQKGYGGGSNVGNSAWPHSTVFHEHLGEIMTHLYFYNRVPGEIEKEEHATTEKAVAKREFQNE